MNNRAQLLISAVDQTRGAFSSIKRNLGELGTVARSLNGLLGTLGLAVSAAGLGALVKSSLESADGLSKLSQRVGITVESLSTLIPVAELSGVSAEKFEGGLRKLAVRMLEAATGTDDAVRSFAAVGVAVQDQSGALRATDQVLLALAERFQVLPDGAEKTALAVELFGKSGADLIPFLNQGREGVEALSEEMVALGLQLGGDTAVQAEVFNDALTKVRLATAAIGNRILESLLPAMNDMALSLVNSAKQGGALRGTLDGILLSFKTLVLGAATVGKAFVALGDAIGGSLAAAVQALSGDLAAAKTIMAALKDDLVAELDALAGFRDSLFNPRSTAVAQAPALVADSGIIAQLTPGDSAAQAAERARLALAKTQADAALKQLKTALDQQAQTLDNALADRLLAINAYYEQKTALETRALDAEIARAQSQLAQQQRLASADVRGSGGNDSGNNSGSNTTDNSAQLKAAAEIARLEAELTALNQRRASIVQTNARASAQAERELAGALTQARQELSQITGQASAGDRQAAIEGRYRDLKARLAAESDAAGIALVDRLIDVKAAEANLAALEAEWRLVTERLRNAQGTLALQQQAGLLTEAQARQQIVSLQRQAALELENLLPAMQRAAQAIGPDAVVRVQAWRNELAQTRLTVDTLAPLWNRVGDSFGSALDGMLTGAQTWRSALVNLFQQLSAAFLQQLVVEPFQQWVAMQARMLALKLGFVQQEQVVDAAASSAKVAQKSAETTAVVSMDAAKAGAGAAASQASIPYVGPGLAIAAMAAMVAAVMALLSNVKQFAAGGLVTGPGTATSDSIPARLSAGEFVIHAAAVKRVGVDFLHALNGLSRGPRVAADTLAFASGGLVPEVLAPQPQGQKSAQPQGQGQASAQSQGQGQSSAQGQEQGQSVRIVNVVDPAMAADYLSSASGEKTILNILQRNSGAVRQLLR
ncbi:phage tail protein [Chromatiales bacterium (ex Bugula neritina AB1)]|nr:phage tail protein [Chromatiales bacterium (ex Bugula neritina AB1)]